MSYGKINGFAEIVERVIGKDSEGFKTETDVVIAGVRCWHEQRHASRRWANLATFSVATDRFVIRCHRSLRILPGFFIRCGGERYKIISVEDVSGRGMYLELLAEKAVGILG